MKRRVLQIIPSLDRSGAEKQLVLLATGLPRDEFDVHVAALTRGGPWEEDLRRADVPVTVIGKSLRADPRALWRLTTHVRHLKPDLVQTWLFAANAYGRVAARWAGIGKIVASERSVDPWKNGAELALDRWLARSTDRIVVNSSGVRDFYVGKGLPAGKFTIIPNGMPPAPTTEGTRADVCREFGLPNDARLIVSVGRLWPQKRMKDVIWAADILKVARDDFHVLIVGDGPQRARLERFVAQCEIADRVHLLGHRDDVPWILSHCDALWLASGYEGMPNVVMEAMACGVPVVATDIPGCRDLVVPHQTGFLVRVGDCAAFARHTMRILDDPALAQQLGEAARARVADAFSVERMISRYAELYRSLLAG
ncbi:MAG: glycosyltransferase [Planctomycetales bacterium]|nr:glycosyltransferase [Planctomycetales bacterium]